MNPFVCLGLCHFKLNGVEFLKRVCFQIYQYKEQFVLNQRKNAGLSIVRYTLTNFSFQSKMTIILIPMVLEGYQQCVKFNRS